MRFFVFWDMNNFLDETGINVRFIWKIIHISKYEKTHYQYIEMRFFVFWDMNNFLDETGINDDFGLDKPHFHFHKGLHFFKMTQITKVGGF